MGDLVFDFLSGSSFNLHSRDPRSWIVSTLFSLFLSVKTPVRYLFLAGVFFFLGCELVARNRRVLGSLVEITGSWHASFRITALTRQSRPAFAKCFENVRLGVMKKGLIA